MGSNKQDYDAKDLAAKVREDPNSPDDAKKLMLARWKKRDKVKILSTVADSMRRLIKQDCVTVTAVRIGREYGPYFNQKPSQVTTGPIVAVWCEVPRDRLVLGIEDKNPCSSGSRDKNKQPKNKDLEQDGDPKENEERDGSNRGEGDRDNKDQ